MVSDFENVFINIRFHFNENRIICFYSKLLTSIDVVNKNQNSPTSYLRDIL